MTSYTQHLEQTNYALRHWAQKEKITLRNLWYRFWARWFWISPMICLPKYGQEVKVKGLSVSSLPYEPGDWVVNSHWELVTKWKKV